jgi:hypothetical protein
MSDAPDRIWLTGFIKDNYGSRLGRGTVSDLDHSPNPDYPEYIRADLHRAEVDAAVKRAIAEATETVNEWLFSSVHTTAREALEELASDPAALERIIKGGRE